MKAGTQNDLVRLFTDPRPTSTLGDGSAFTRSVSNSPSTAAPTPTNSATRQDPNGREPRRRLLVGVTGLELNTDYWLVDKAPAGHSSCPSSDPFRLTTDGNGTVVTRRSRFAIRSQGPTSAVHAPLQTSSLAPERSGFRCGRCRTRPPSLSRTLRTPARLRAASESTRIGVAVAL